MAVEIIYAFRILRWTVEVIRVHGHESAWYSVRIKRAEPPPGREPTAGAR